MTTDDRIEADDTQRAVIEDHYTYIGSLRTGAVERITDSLEHLTRATNFVRELTSEQVYDTELIEGSAGSDVTRHLETAACALRAARAVFPID